jgi:hypothetical protein
LGAESIRYCCKDSLIEVLTYNYVVWLGVKSIYCLVAFSGTTRNNKKKNGKKEEIKRKKKVTNNQKGLIFYENPFFIFISRKKKKICATFSSGHPIHVSEIVNWASIDEVNKKGYKNPILVLVRDWLKFKYILITMIFYSHTTDKL